MPPPKLLLAKLLLATKKKVIPNGTETFIITRQLPMIQVATPYQCTTSRKRREACLMLRTHSIGITTG